MHVSMILIVISKMRLKLSKNLSKVFQYMWIPLSDIFFFKKLGDPCQFQSLKFWKFYNVKTWFLTIFKCHFEALRVFFWKNVRKQTPPKMANFGGVYFLTFFQKTNRFGARRASKWHLNISWHYSIFSTSWLWTSKKRLLAPKRLVFWKNVRK